MEETLTIGGGIIAFLIVVFIVPPYLTGIAVAMFKMAYEKFN
jgi:hypothetical protein